MAASLHASSTVNVVTGEEMKMTRPLATYALALLVAAAPVLVSAAQKPPKSPAKSLKLDHFWCYIVSSQTPQDSIKVILEDQFQNTTVDVGEPLQFCNP